MNLRRLVLLLVLFVTTGMAYLIWTVQHKARAARVPDVDTSWLQQPENDDAPQRKQFHDELKGYIEKEDFKSLERIAADLTAHKARFSGGDWKLKRFYEAVSSPPSGYTTERVDWPVRIASIRKWTEQMPDSVYAVIALAEVQVGSAWNQRGTGYADSVTQEGRKGFNAGLDEAEKTLNKIADRRSACPAWFATMQRIGLGSKWDLQRMQSLLDEAVKVEPLYFDFYVEHAQYLMPRWYGTQGDWERFAEKSADSIGGNEGAILYSEICWQISRHYDYETYYTENHVSYPRIRAGFVERMKRYGPSYRYMNAFCIMAGAANDRITTRALMDRIGDHWEPDFWQDKKYFDDYKSWAAQ